MSAWPLLRSQVVQADIGLEEPKLFVVVSNNKRNRALRSVLAAQLTSSAKPVMPSIVPLGADDTSFLGHVVCDNIVELFDDEILAVRGSLHPSTMASVNEALLAALGID